MNLSGVISAIEAAGLDPDPYALLDALWLAQFALDLAPVTREAEHEGEGGGARDHGRPVPSGHGGKEQDHPTGVPDPPPRPVARHPTENMVDAYPVGILGRGSRRAVPLEIGAAPPLPDRLDFARAIKPLQRRWPSQRDRMLDEEATAERTAEARLARASAIVPVLRPRLERWFDLEIILEEDASILLWSDTIASLAQAFRDTGAFREVRRWQLHLPRSDGSGRAELVAPSGARLRAAGLGAGERRLILFATHGASRHWHTGIYDHLLADWAVHSSVALLPLLPARSWPRTPLGGPGGKCSADMPGMPSMLLQAHPGPWSEFDDGEECYAIPFVEMTPAAVSAWAGMLMSRGRPVPARFRRYPVEPLPPEAWDVPKRVPDQAKTIEIRVQALRERSREAFELAVLLAPTSFTVPVARLIQEAHFGKVDQAVLAELFVSGLLIAGPSKEQGALSATYRINPSAAELLLRSLRGRDVEALVQELVASVTAHIQKRSGNQLSQTVFTPDANGQFALPETVRPFAAVAAQLRRTVSSAIASLPLDSRLRALPRRALRRLLSLHRARSPISREDVEVEAWQLLMADDVAVSSGDSHRILRDEAAAAIAAIVDTQPLWGTRLLWVDDRPENNEHLAREFAALGTTVVTALTTDKALAIVDDQFDLIISDMGRVEGPREGFALLDALRASDNAIPVLVFAGGFARSTRNREDALAAGALLCTNSADEVYSRGSEILMNAETPSLQAIGRWKRRAEHYLLVITADKEGSRLHARSGEAFAIAMENYLGVRGQNIRRITAAELAARDHGPGELFPGLAGGTGATAVVYVGGPVTDRALESIKGFEVDGIAPGSGPLDRLVLALRSNGLFSQAMMVIDGGLGPVPSQAHDGIDRQDSPSWLLLAAASGPAGPQDRGVLPLTTRLIEMVEEASRGAILDGHAFATASRDQRGPKVLVQQEGPFKLRKLDDSGGPVVRPWTDYLREGVDLANKRRRETDIRALRSYERALALVPDVPDKERLARLLVYRAAILKRLGRLEEARAQIEDESRVWSGTRAEGDAWYNLASVYAQLGEREPMLDALFAIRDDRAKMEGVRSHRSDYFEKFGRDPAFLAFLEGREGSSRTLGAIEEGQFCTRSEILEVAGGASDLARNERPRGLLRIFATERQQTWLVATSQSLLVLLDDEDTRTAGTLVQQVWPRAGLRPVLASVEGGGRDVVVLTDGGERASWYYSPRLFEEGPPIEAAISDLLEQSLSRSVVGEGAMGQRLQPRRK